MGWAQHESGSSTLVVDTEQIIGTTAQGGDATFQLQVDFTNAVAGDVFLIRGYEKIKSSTGNQIVTIIGTVAGVQTSKRWFSVPDIFIHGGKYTLEQTDGSARTLDWSIRTITS